MLGELTPDQIDHVLQGQVVGRIGSYAQNEVYVVPVTYVFEDGFIYCHSRDGLKIQRMRENPEICFQVDALENMANWRSVILWGKYEELTNTEDQHKAMHILTSKLTPLITSETVKPHRQTMSPQIVEKQRRAIFFRIRIDRKTGRFEKN